MSSERNTPALSVDLFGGRGEVRVWSLLAGTAGPFTAVLSCMLSPGGSVGSHRQEQFPELVIGLEGNGAATVDGAVFPLGPGAVVYLPLGSVLSIANHSLDAALSYLIVKCSDVKT